MDLTNNENPFVGLRPFESDQSLLFFGRQEQTVELLQRLHEHHFVAVIGSSGSGKSSLIKAGLIPSLKAGYLVDDHDRWLIASLKPGQSPLYNLASAIATQLPLTGDHLSAADLQQQILEEGSDALVKLIRSLWKENETNFFLLVDQFEELFRFPASNPGMETKDEAIDFVNILLELSRHPDLPVYIVITMRSDFIGDCTQFFGLPEAMNESQYLVPRLNRVQLRSIIEGPVKLFGERISPVLVSKLLNDISKVKDELPLLQHALMRVWQHHMIVPLTSGKVEIGLGDYEYIGGIEKALSNHADLILSAIDKYELDLTKKIFQALTTIDENGRKIRRPVQLKELEQITGVGREKINSIIDLFIGPEISFLVKSPTSEPDNEIIDISHESLIRQWSTLNAWVEEESESAKTYRRLAEAATLYKQNKKDLLSGNELHQILEWYASFKPSLTWARKYNINYEENVSYLQASAKAEKIKATRKRLLLTGVILFVSVTAFLFFLAYRNAAAARNANQSLLVKNYWSSSQRSKTENHLVEALHFIAEGLSINNETEVNEMMLYDIEASLPDWKLATVIKEKGYIHYAEFSPDGKLLAAACEDSIVHIWDVTSGKQVGSGMKHMGPVYKAVFSPDGTRIATASGDTARLWDVKSQRLISDVMIHDDDVNTIAFSASGRKLVTGGTDNTARIWDLENPKKQGIVLQHLGVINAAVFSPDETEIATATSNRDAHLWDAITGQRIGSEMLHDGYVLSIVFSPDGKKLLTAGMDRVAKIWDVSSQKQISDLTHSGGVFAARFSVDGSRIVSACADGAARIWDANTGAKVCPEMKHKGAVLDAIFSPDGKQVLTAGEDKVARLWDATTGHQIGPDFKHDEYVTNIAFNRKGNRILTVGADNTIHILELASTKHADIVVKQPAKILSAVFSGDGRNIITGGTDSCVRFLDGTSARQISPAIRNKSKVNAVVFSADGKTLLTASRDWTARLWDVKSGKQKGADMVHRGPINSISFSKDDKMVLTASSDTTAGIWDATTGIPIGNKIIHESQVNTAVFNPDGTKVLTASEDLYARIWDLNGKLLLPKMKHNSTVETAVFSPDGKNVLTAGTFNRAGLWDATTGEEIGKGMNHESFVNSAVFSPDGKKIVTASQDMSAKLWDAKDGRQIAPDMKHEEAVKKATFSFDGKRVMTIIDSIVRTWYVADGRQLGLDMKQLSRITTAILNPDGERLLTIGDDSTVHLWMIGADLDLPKSLFKLQIQVATGYQLNSETSNLESISADKWYQQKEEYNMQAKEHYKNCKYRNYNYWIRFNPGEASNITQ